MSLWEEYCVSELPLYPKLNGPEDPNKNNYKKYE